MYRDLKTYNCENCGKLVRIRKWEDAPEHIYCNDCKLAITKLILKQLAAARREIIQLTKKLDEVTAGEIRMAAGDVHDVLVYGGMAPLAKLLGEEIQVIEMDESREFDWVFQFEHGGLTYHTYESMNDKEDRAIAEAWEAKHETF